MLSVFLAQRREARAQQHKLYCVEKVGLAAPVAAHDDIVLRAKGLNLALRAEAAESADYYLLDVHSSWPGGPVRSASLFGESVALLCSDQPPWSTQILQTQRKPPVLVCVFLAPTTDTARADPAVTW